MSLPEIPKSWLVITLLVALCVLRAMNYDSFVTAGIMGLAGYITGQHVESLNPSKTPPNTP